MERLLISACLLGSNCKYDGGNNALPADVIDALRRRYEMIPFCPETAGGLPIPREPSERRDGCVYSRSGRDVTSAFEKGAELCLKLAAARDCRLALMKERSPSCGSGQIYDGSFSSCLIPGWGTAAELLHNTGITVYGEDDIEKLIEKEIPSR